jgi:hypothetical protein
VRPITSQDFELRGCSKWVAPDGSVYLELPKYFIFSVLVPAGSTLPTQQQPASPSYEFLLDVVSVFQPLTTPAQSDIYGRFQWPNGHFSAQQLEDLTQFYGLGQWGRLQEPPVSCPPGSIIRMQLQNPGGADSRITIHFEGRLRIPLVPCGYVKPCN